jgi:uncharacterized protein (DUF433 family)
MNEKEALLTRIIINPEILVGKPIIKGTRLAVEHVLDLLGEGMTTEEILQDYTQLKKEDILACILFARELLADITYAPLFVK